MDEIRKYVKLPEKELKIIEHYMATILSYKAINILNYLFSIDGVYEYVLKHYAKDKEVLEKFRPKKLTKEKSGYFSRFFNFME